MKSTLFYLLYHLWRWRSEDGLCKKLSKNEKENCEGRDEEMKQARAQRAKEENILGKNIASECCKWWSFNKDIIAL